jgi:hypothetical protein
MVKVSCEVKHRVMAPLDPVQCSNHIWTLSSDTSYNHSIPPLSKLSVDQKNLIMMIAGNCRGLISLSRLEGPANRSFRSFLLDFVSLKANRERKRH